MSVPHPDPSGTAVRDRLWTRLGEAVAAAGPLPTPLAVVDLDAFDANADDLHRRAGRLPLRVASKSLRVPALLERALAHDGFTGVLGYTLAEALWLLADDGGARLGGRLGAGVDGVLVAYPTVDRGALSRLLASPEALAAVTLMVDDVAHLDVVDAVRGPGQRDAPVRVAVDVDAGLHLPRGGLVGPRRSPLRSTAAVAALGAEVARRPGFRLVGAMTYEGQVAGVPDRVPGQRLRSAAVRGIKTWSLAQLGERRRAAVAALAAHADGGRLELVDAGGSGSVAQTAADPAVTEVAAGSGLLVPTLFDHYGSFTPRPAAFFALPVTRRPAPDVATVHGGGLVASGAAGPDRLPTPWAPPGLALTGLEGAGEVQTPLVGPSAASLLVGDLVWFRHAKSGELLEHVGTVHLLRGDRFVEEVRTYRGHGLCT